MSYPFERNRILRKSSSIREAMSETHLSTSHLLLPIFIIPGENEVSEITSMPGVYRYTLDRVNIFLQEAYDYGIRQILLFAQVEEHLKDNAGTEALNSNGLMQQGIVHIKSAFPDMVVMTDVALDPCSSYGHDGIVVNGKIVNDATVDILCAMALSHVEAGADWIAPSDMMDGRIGSLRQCLNEHGYHEVGILAYTAKYASNLYGPFRDALDSAPGFGDKKTYQMDFRNAKEALREARQDVEEGADFIMVKPGGMYLDVIKDLATHFDVPVAAYQVSGEYSMISSACANGFLDRKAVVMESLYAMRRAGASLIATYFAVEAAKYTQNK
ncbi:MAG: porphobilinogen synthase [Saprospirales bacterium]|nr:porphobilinogen synthase [Saprospirales bacterium]